MSALNPKGVKIDINGREYELLFTLNAIDKIQDITEQTLPEIMLTIADVKNRNSIGMLKIVLSILLTDYSERIHDPLFSPISQSSAADIIPISPEQAGMIVTAENWAEIIEKVLLAYGYCMPEPDPEEDEPDFPKAGNSSSS